MKNDQDNTKNNTLQNNENNSFFDAKNVENIDGMKFDNLNSVSYAEIFKLNNTLNQSINKNIKNELLKYDEDLKKELKNIKQQVKENKFTLSIPYKDQKNILENMTKLLYIQSTIYRNTLSYEDELNNNNILNTVNSFLTNSNFNRFEMMETNDKDVSSKKEKYLKTIYNMALKQYKEFNKNSKYQEYEELHKQYKTLYDKADDVLRKAYEAKVPKQDYEAAQNSWKEALKNQGGIYYTKEEREQFKINELTPINFIKKIVTNEKARNNLKSSDTKEDLLYKVNRDNLMVSEAKTEIITKINENLNEISNNIHKNNTEKYYNTMTVGLKELKDKLEDKNLTKNILQFFRIDVKSNIDSLNKDIDKRIDLIKSLNKNPINSKRYAQQLVEKDPKKVQNFFIKILDKIKVFFIEMLNKQKNQQILDKQKDQQIPEIKNLHKIIDDILTTVETSREIIKHFTTMDYIHNSRNHLDRVNFKLKDVSVDNYRRNR